MKALITGASSGLGKDMAIILSGMGYDIIAVARREDKLLELKNELTNNMKYQDGITLSGGDPFMQISAVLEIAKHVKTLGKNVWAYTGFTFEKLIEISEKHPNMLELLNNIDVLVDGKFIESEKSYDLYYKGSRNQRIIDVAKSLENKEVVLVSKYAKEKTYNKLAEKKDYIFV